MANKSRFEDESVSAALDRAIRNAKHLRAKDAAAVAAARMLAKRMDSLGQPTQSGKPEPWDNTLAPTFLNHLKQLGLIPEAKPATSAARREPSTAPKQVSELESFRAQKGMTG